MIPRPTAKQVAEAMKRYDETERGTDGADRWVKDGAYHYAIEQDGQLYPVKKIVAQATGAEVSDFSQGQGLRRHLGNPLVQCDKVDTE